MKFRVDKSIARHKTELHGGISSIGLEYGSKIIDYSTNVNPLGYPSLKYTPKRESYLYSNYPDPSSTRLKNCLGRYVGVSKDHIVVGNGATEILYNFCKAFLSGGRALIPIPTFSEYESASKLCGASVSFMKTMNLNEDTSKFLRMIPKNGCVFVCNPNNPTGVMTDKKNMLDIVDSALDKSTIVFIDECFIELTSRSEESIIPYICEYENIFVLRSMTKSFGLAGLRVGYGLGSKKIIKILNKIKIPWNVSSIAQDVAIKSLSHMQHLERTRKVIEKERAFLMEEISKINGFSCYDSETNFLLIKTKIESKQLQKKLLKRNIMIRDCSNFRGLGNKFIRIAVRTHKENLKLVETLQRL